MRRMCDAASSSAAGLAVVFAAGMFVSSANAQIDLGLLNKAKWSRDAAYQAYLNAFSAYYATPNEYSQSAAAHAYYSYVQAQYSYSCLLGVGAFVDIDGWKKVDQLSSGAVTMAFQNWQRTYRLDAYYSFYYSWVAAYYAREVPVLGIL